MVVRDKILVVEDEKNISCLIRTILVTNGYDVISAVSGTEALTMISSHCPELVVLDLGLPDMDGVELIRSVRRWTSLPIIVVLCVWVLTAPFLLAKRLRNKTIYGLTDRRVIRIGVNPESVPYERIQTAALRMDPDGHTTLLCGPKAVKLPPEKWRGKSDAGVENEAGASECARFILNALPMDSRLRGLLEEHLPLS